jgi:hypothetical protein
VEWTRDPETPFTIAALELLKMVSALNRLPASEFPTAILSKAVDRDLKLAALHDPANGRGDDREADTGNKSGSALLLASALPEIYGVPGSTPLKCFGYPLPDHLLYVSTSPQKSGAGVDNRRNNVWETLLNHWQSCDRRRAERDLVYRAMCAMSEAMASSADGCSWQVARHALQTDITSTLGAKPRTLNGHMV